MSFRSAIQRRVFYIDIRTVLRLLVLSWIAPSIATAQGHVGAGPVTEACSVQDNKAFQRRLAPGHEITARFISKPLPNDGADKMKKYFIYSRILGRYASRQLYNYSLRRCSFGPEVAASFDLHFELYSVGNNVHNECSLSYCARLFSSFLESVVIDKASFASTVDAITKSIRDTDSAHLRNFRLGVPRAAREAYRHIYRSGTQERTFIEISADDFHAVTLEEFVGWFSAQQGFLRSESRSSAPPQQLGSAGTPSSNEAISCEASPKLNVNELNIDHDGWGQNALILIKDGFKESGLSGITNRELRALCPPSEVAPDDERWQEMASKISCIRETVNQDRWLVLFSKKEAQAATASDMRRYADTIVQALREDKCVRPNTQVLLAIFSRQK